MYRFLLVQKTERSDSILHDSAVRCLILTPLARKVVSLIIEKPSHFGVALYEGFKKLAGNEGSEIVWGILARARKSGPPLRNSPRRNSLLIQERRIEQ